MTADLADPAGAEAVIAAIGHRPVGLHCAVAASVPGKLFRFTAASRGLHADHAFTLTETPQGTRVLSEETQSGALPAAGRALLGPSLHRAAQRWLEDLAATAPAARTSPA